MGGGIYCQFLLIMKKEEKKKKRNKKNFWPKIVWLKFVLGLFHFHFVSQFLWQLKRNELANETNWDQWLRLWLPSRRSDINSMTVFRVVDVESSGICLLEVFETHPSRQRDIPGNTFALQRSCLSLLSLVVMIISFPYGTPLRPPVSYFYVLLALICFLPAVSNFLKTFPHSFVIFKWFCRLMHELVEHPAVFSSFFSSSSLWSGT